MRPRFRVLLFGLAFAPSAHADETAEAAKLPPIFAPRVTPPAPASAPTARPAASRAGLSDHVRRQLSERILTDLKSFELPPAATPASASVTGTADNVVIMPRFFVKSLTPRQDETELPPVPIRFHPVERIDRKRHVLSATLFRFLDGNGSFNVNVVNAAGSGADHTRQWTRVEFEFSINW